MSSLLYFVDQNYQAEFTTFFYNLKFVGQFHNLPILLNNISGPSLQQKS